MEPRPSRRRERTELFAEILEVVKHHHGRARLTRMSYAVGMPVDRLKLALGRLRSLSLIDVEDLGGVTVYDLTVRGQQFLDTYWKMRAFTELLARDVPLPEEPLPGSGPPQ
jgi:predicted transcriptional regulator